jgi:hypothetical protein
MLSPAMRIHECFLNFSLFGAIRERNFEAQLPARFRRYSRLFFRTVCSRVSYRNIVSSLTMNDELTLYGTGTGNICRTFSSLTLPRSALIALGYAFVDASRPILNLSLLNVQTSAK